MIAETLNKKKKPTEDTTYTLQNKAHVLHWKQIADKKNQLKKTEQTLTQARPKKGT